MSYWDTERQAIVAAPPSPYPDAAGWQLIDCGCCAGIEWGGSEPRECRDCGGCGHLARHIKSGVLAQYPGGPLRGKVAA